jgi:hypothetical protein
MFSKLPPRSILWASDSPYGTPTIAAMFAGRTALQAGITPEQLRVIFGPQLERALAGKDPIDLGPAPDDPRPMDPLLERALLHITNTIARVFGRVDYDEPLGLARLACAVGEDGPHAEVHAEVMELLDLFESEMGPPPPGRGFPPAIRYLVAANIVARTPDVPLPERPSAPAPTREHAE